MTVLWTVRAATGFPQKANPLPSTKIKNPVVKVENLLLPDEPSVSQDYFIMSPRKKIWDTEEKEKWFHEPDTKTLDQLYKSNDILIQNILEEAP